VKYALSCNDSIPLLTGQLSMTVFSHSGETGNYSFDFLEPANTDIGVTALNILMEGTLAPRERLIATLPLTSSERIFITSNQEVSCSQRWNLIDAIGAYRIVLCAHSSIFLGSVEFEIL
jgi:hypothetical protein